MNYNAISLGTLADLAVWINYLNVQLAARLLPPHMLQGRQRQASLASKRNAFTIALTRALRARRARPPLEVAEKLCSRARSVRKHLVR